MLFNDEIAPIDADDDAIRAHPAAGELPPLLIALAHVLGDMSFLREDLRPKVTLLEPQGGLSEDQQAAARELAVEGLIRYRDLGCPTPPEPTPDTLREIISWGLGEDSEDLLPLLTEEMVLPGRDPKAPRWSQDALAPDRDFRVAVVGAGMSGLLAAHRLAQAGVSFVIYEKNAGIGGTWLENTYPGCRVDVPNHLFSYSCAVKTDWPHHFCTQDVLRQYFEDFAEHFGLREHIRFETEVRSARWDDEHCLWHLTLDGPGGDEQTDAHAVVTAVGQLNRPNVPDIPGRDSFAGPAFHSARWDHDVDLAGKRVAVVGTGASAFQFVPAIAELTRELVVLRRTPPWLLPTPDYHDEVPGGRRWLFEHVPYYAPWYRFWLFVPGLRGLLEAAVVDPEYRPTEHAISAVNKQYRDMIAAAMEAQVADAPDLRDHVIPDYPFGAKRMLRDNGVWLGALKRDDVRLITDAIERITARGIVTADGTEHAVDVIIYGTGFHAAEFLLPMQVSGSGGADVHQTWDGDARAYLGTMIAGLPNLFCMYGPNTNLVVHGGSIIFSSECQATYVVDAVRHLLETGNDALEVRCHVFADFNARVDDANAVTAWGWSSVPTWYRNAKGRSAQNWPLSALEFWERTHAVDPADFELLRARTTDAAAR